MPKKRVYERLLRPADSEVEVEGEEEEDEQGENENILVEPPPKKRRKTNSVAKEISPEPQEISPKQPKIPVVKRRKSRPPRYNRGEIEAIQRMIDRVRKSQNRSKSLDPIRKKKRLSSKLYQMLQKTDEEYDRNIRCLNGHSISTKIFYYLKEFDLFARLLSTRIRRSAELGDDLHLEMGNRIGTKDSTELMANEREHPRKEDSLFAWKYIAQVKLAFKLPKHRRIFKEFLKILEEVPMNSDFVAEFYAVSCSLS